MYILKKKLSKNKYQILVIKKGKIIDNLGLKTIRSDLNKNINVYSLNLQKCRFWKIRGLLNLTKKIIK